jgi:hypothetical protein
MKLKEVFDQLTYGELSQIFIGGGTAGEIRQADYGKVVAHINLGLTAIYKRFHLKEGRFVVELQDGLTTYQLSSQYCQSNTRSRQVVKYIDDTAFPFADTLLKVEHVFAESGFEFSVNNPVDKLSINTPSQRVLTVPAEIVAQDPSLVDELKTSTLEVVFRANHKKIVVEDNDIEPEEYELELPETHLEPLLFFVASRVHTPAGVGGEDNTGNMYYQRYELACQALENQNFQIDKGAQYNRLEKNGWV